MLPNNLAGSYRRYKEDTNVFATWLLSTAERCGYKSEYSDETPQQQSAQPRTSARLKGKARKQAKKTAAASPLTFPTSPTFLTAKLKRISTKEMLLQAEMVANFKKRPVEMPMDIRNILERAIRARTRCATWFRSAKTDEDKESNRTHEHFIATLEMALTILEPCMEKAKVAGSSSPPKGENDIPHGKNPYGMLEVEDVGGDSLDITTTDIITVSKVDTNKGHNICELDIESKADLDFVVFCFFEDLQRIQEYLKETWKLVAKGELDTVTAALVSNLSLNLARQTEDELISTYPNFFGKVPSYISIATVLHEVQLNNSRVERQDGVSKSSSLDEFIYYSTFLILYKYQKFGQMQSNGAQCVIPMNTMFSTVDSAFTRLGIPVMPAMAATNASWKNEDMLLSQMLIDLTKSEYVTFYNSMNFNEEIKKQRQASGTTVPWPFEDEFTKGLISSSVTDNIRVSVVFGARAIMDIVQILGDDAGNAYESLRRKASVASHTLRIRFDRTKEAGFQNSLKELDRDWITQAATQRAIDLGHRIQETVKNSAFVRVKSSHLRAMKNVIPDHHSLFDEFKNLKRETIWPSEDRAFYYNNNPIYCGLEWFRIAINMEKEGIILCNTVTSFFAVAHLYNALRQDGFIQGKWAALDNAIALHLGQLFNGILPTSGKQIISRFLMKTGVPASAFARNCRQSSKAMNLGVDVVRGTANMLKPTEISQALMDYLEDPTAADRLLMQSQIYERLNTTGNKAKVRQHTPLEILKGMREWLPQIIARIETPYITLTRQCSLLLVRIREAFNKELGIDNKIGRVDCAEVHPHENVMTVMNTLGEAYSTELSDDGDPNAPQATVLQIPRLLIAARVTEEFLKNVDKEEPVKPFPVPESTQLVRELSQKGKDLQEKYLAGDHSPEVLDGLRMAFAEASM
ncbi:hypothetical protein NHQ30_004154 [Ciborinia camelliae]|nr:hypothetical protein NHQ30_004154 [Ciborinia camelliae]